VSVAPWVAPKSPHWLLNEVSSSLRFRRERRPKLNELRVELYAEWLEGVREFLRDYASDGLQSPPPRYDRLLSLRKLLLVEQDEKARKLVHGVLDSIPAYGAEAWQDLQNIDDEWPPFTKTVDELMEFVRRSLR
jgi:hypothetical protein